jgi:hypothetical protein
LLLFVKFLFFQVKQKSRALKTKTNACSPSNLTPGPARIHSCARESCSGRYLLSCESVYSGTDVHSVGNRLSDNRAYLARQHPDRSSPWSSLQLPVSDCERRLCLWEADGKGPLIIDDIRRTAMAQIKSSAWTYWTAKSDGLSFLAGQGMLDLSAIVLKHGTAHM